MARSLAETRNRIETPGKQITNSLYKFYMCSARVGKLSSRRLGDLTGMSRNDIATFWRGTIALSQVQLQRLVAAAQYGRLDRSRPAKSRELVPASAMLEPQNLAMCTVPGTVQFAAVIAVSFTRPDPRCSR
jgi:hypothetical protein